MLVGVSRSSKTPTSFYLANRGIKAANVPLVPELPDPPGLENPPCPVIGLTIEPEGTDRDPPPSPEHDRHRRRRRTRARIPTDYVDLDAVKAELLWARRLCGKRGWPVIDVTRRSIEETAATVLQHHGRLARAPPARPRRRLRARAPQIPPMTLQRPVPRLWCWPAPRPPARRCWQAAGLGFAPSRRAVDEAPLKRRARAEGWPPPTPRCCWPTPRPRPSPAGARRPGDRLRPTAGLRWRWFDKPADLEMLPRPTARAPRPHPYAGHRRSLPPRRRAPLAIGRLARRSPCAASPTASSRTTSALEARARDRNASAPTGWKGRAFTCSRRSKASMPPSSGLPLLALLDFLRRYGSC